jgi:hypothetical protein
MGPFRFFAGMQCAHGVISMGHSLSGALELNGEHLDFPMESDTLRQTEAALFPPNTSGHSAFGTAWSAAV